MLHIQYKYKHTLFLVANRLFHLRFFICEPSLWRCTNNSRATKSSFTSIALSQIKVTYSLDKKKRNQISSIIQCHKKIDMRSKCEFSIIAIGCLLHSSTRFVLFFRFYINNPKFKKWTITHIILSFIFLHWIRGLSHDRPYYHVGGEGSFYEKFSAYCLRHTVNIHHLRCRLIM
jgi:hypothetical protein